MEEGAWGAEQKVFVDETERKRFVSPENVYRSRRTFRCAYSEYRGRAFKLAGKRRTASRTGSSPPGVPLALIDPRKHRPAAWDCGATFAVSPS
eukprot:4200454-Prymnesium_polylepis.1